MQTVAQNRAESHVRGYPCAWVALGQTARAASRTERNRPARIRGSKAISVRLLASSYLPVWTATLAGAGISGAL
jgi:hypothetical protein